MKNRLIYKLITVFVLVVLIVSSVACTKLPNENGKTPIDKIIGNKNNTATDEPDVETANPTESDKPKGNTYLNLRAVGDIMMHGTQIEAGKNADGSYDYKSFFEDIKPYLEDADITVGNFECTIGDGSLEYSGYPVFRSPEAIAEAIKYAGFDVMLTANNHSLDGKEFGVTYTLDIFDKYDLLYTGTARSQEERDKVLLVEKNDIKIAFLSYTYGTNGMEVTIPKEKLPYMVNYIDKEKMSQDIKRAKEAGAEVIAVAMHWGVEYQRTPSNEQKELADFLFNEGVDIILGSHPHVIQPMEKRTITLEDGTEKDVFIIYSLGNFISNQMWQYSDSGVIVDIQIVKNHDTGEVSIGEIGYIPTWVQRTDLASGKSEYRILPVAQYRNSDELNTNDSNRIKEVWNETTEHISDGSFGVIE